MNEHANGGLRDVDGRKRDRGSTDTIGLWFAAAAVFAFVAAGAIVYRAANQDDMITASNDVPATAKASPVGALQDLPAR